MIGNCMRVPGRLSLVMKGAIVRVPCVRMLLCDLMGSGRYQRCANSPMKVVMSQRRMDEQARGCVEQQPQGCEQASVNSAYQERHNFFETPQRPTQGMLNCYVIILAIRLQERQRIVRHRSRQLGKEGRGGRPPFSPKASFYAKRNGIRCMR